MLEIKNVSKTYRGNTKKSCEDINLEIKEGDIYGFIGPNGAGKSTTIKCICGIHPFDCGEITLNGISIKDNPLEAKKMMAYIPDNPVLYEHLTGNQYLNYICDIYEVSDRLEAIDKYTKLFQIDTKLNNQIGSYSHGMKQKLALCSAFIHNPKLIILDEPFVGLDPKASHDVKEVLQDLASKGAMIFFSSHVLEVVEKFTNKIAIIKDGKIVASGDINEVIGEGSLEERFMDLYE